jgi:hypothetical protein
VSRQLLDASASRAAPRLHSEGRFMATSRAECSSVLLDVIQQRAKSAHFGGVWPTKRTSSESQNGACGRMHVNTNYDCVVVT